MRTTVLWTLLSSAVLTVSHVWGTTVLHTDDFQDGTLQGWTTGPGGPVPQLLASGGPAGEEDQFLQFSADGGFGPGSHLAVFNTGEEWTGSYADLDVMAVEVDMMNPPSTPASLDMRLVLFGPGSTSNRWTSTTSVSVPNDGVWRRLSFPIASADLTGVLGNASFDAMLADVVRVMFRHDSGTPTSGGSTVVGSLGIDNVTLVGLDSDVCDFNGDGVLDVQDLDLMLAEVHAGSNNSEFDLNDDELVNAADIKLYVESPDKLNTFIGDANLDGEFNSSDMVQAFVQGKYETGQQAMWAEGDWTGDLEFNSSDMVAAFVGGGFEIGERPAVALPEPNTATLVLASAILLPVARRKLSRR